MLFLVLGLTLFVAIHLSPNFTSLRRYLVGRFGEKEYKIGFSAISLLAFGLIVIGMRDAEYVQIWLPPVWLHLFVLPIMFVGFFFLASTIVPSNMPRLVRHPMSIGVVFLCVAHLLVNDDLAAIVLFSTVAIFSIVHMLLANRRGAERSTRRYPFRLETMPVAVGGILLMVSFLLHSRLIGVPPGIH
ncbi:MAG: NnrU family protein [Gammaproteobacteria bacterium]